MQSYYEINVSLNGRHFFATAPRWLVTKQEALFFVNEMRVKFPEKEGYSVSCTHYECSGTRCDF